MNIAALTLAEASRRLRAREFSALELCDACLERISTLDPRLNSFITITAESARAQARKADEELALGQDRGPLHGMPLSLKDLFETCGVRTTAGSIILRDFVPAEDAAVVTRLKAAGAVLLGKSNMHEWAYGVTNDNPHFGRAANPWDADRSPGGSSGGSAAAVAARLVLGSFGSDTGGSIRIPAALCGITGLKLTYGRVSLRGVIPLSWTMDHAGPLAQTAQDAALLLGAAAGYDPRDPASVDRPVPDYAASLGEPISGLRIAVPSGYFERGVDDAINGAIQEALGVLARSGAVIVRLAEGVPFAEELYGLNRTILRVEAAAVHHEHMKQRADGLGADIKTRLSEAASISAQDYALARRRQVELSRALEEVFSEIDILVTPTTRTVAPPWDAEPVAMSSNLTAFTAPFNLTGWPAISIPCGFTRAGLPVGLQMVARPWREELLLRAAHHYQLLTDWHTRLPPSIT